MRPRGRAASARAARARRPAEARDPAAARARPRPRAELPPPGRTGPAARGPRMPSTRRGSAPERAAPGLRDARGPLAGVAAGVGGSLGPGAGGAAGGAGVPPHPPRHCGSAGWDRLGGSPLPAPRVRTRPLRRASLARRPAARPQGPSPRGARLPGRAGCPAPSAPRERE